MTAWPATSPEIGKGMEMGWRYIEYDESTPRRSSRALYFTRNKGQLPRLQLQHQRDRHPKSLFQNDNLSSSIFKSLVIYCTPLLAHACHACRTQSG